REGFDLTVVGVADSKRFALNPNGLSLGRWREELTGSRRRMDPRVLAREVAKLQLTNVALVDCTADAGIVDAYPHFVNADMHIITPNKRANVLPYRRYATLIELLRSRQKYFLYEANVGAGLPILSTLRDLVASGDVVEKIEGVFSGTLSYLFNTFDGSVPFSAIVHQAHEMGLTEPDPRDDLSGQDVARKLLILARQAGSTMEIGDVRVESLVGPRMDEKLEARRRRAHARGAVLRYVGTLERGRARAGLREFPRDHPIAGTKGSDNVIAFTTR